MPELTVLIVDDGPQNRKLLSSLVRMEKHRVLEAVNGTEALKIIDSETIDLIFLDLMMPEESGFGVLDGMDARGLLPLLPVIVVTSHDLRTLRLEALRRGVADYLTKPIDRLELTARMRNILDLHKTQREQAHKVMLERSPLGDALNLLSEGVVQLDAQGLVVYANEAADVGIGHPLHDAISDADRATLDEALEAAAQSDEPVPLTVTRSDGRTSLTAHLRRIAHDQVICILGSIP